MNPFEIFNADLRACRKCEEILNRKCVDARSSDERVEPRPISSNLSSRPIMLIGQAPGLTEYQRRLPFQGPAGQAIRAVFAECGIPQDKFSDQVQSTAVAKCFPGSKIVPIRKSAGVRREDEKPSATMIRNCQPLLERQIELSDPRVIVLLGGLPLQTFLRMSGTKAPKADLASFVGKVIAWGTRKVVTFPHTSGASFWLNDPNNRQLFAEAKALLRKEIQSLQLA